MPKDLLEGEEYVVDSGHLVGVFLLPWGVARGVWYRWWFRRCAGAVGGLWRSWGRWCPGCWYQCGGGGQGREVSGGGGGGAGVGSQPHGGAGDGLSPAIIGGGGHSTYSILRHPSAAFRFRCSLFLHFKGQIIIQKSNTYQPLFKYMPFLILPPPMYDLFGVQGS